MAKEKNTPRFQTDIDQKKSYVDDVDQYIIEDGLAAAVQLALLLNQPLLLTGKPGTGKTKLAHKIARVLAETSEDRFLKEPLVFNTKTTSAFTDLFYIYDALGRFHASNFADSEKKVDVRGFIQLQALGQAIILSNAALEPGYKILQRLGKLELNTELAHSSVVLIDEVDKAPRDFTNDLLHELETMEFSVKEHENHFYEKGRGKILLILTSNSEKNLPDAFLRRCLFFHIEAPGPDLLKKIVIAQLFEGAIDETDPEGFRTNAALATYLEYFNSLGQLRLKKDPATAELISWIFFFRPHIQAGTAWEALDTGIQLASLSIIAKQSEDMALLKKQLVK